MTALAPGHVTVFELLNGSLKELYLGVARTTSEREAFAQLKTLPTAIAHWGKKQPISYHELADSLLAGDAVAFMEAYSQSMRDGWRILR